MKDWKDFTENEQADIIVQFHLDKQDDMSIAEQCGLEHYINDFLTVSDLDGCNEDLFLQGLKEWFYDNQDWLQDTNVPDNYRTDHIFWKQGFGIFHCGGWYEIQRIDDVKNFDPDLDFKIPLLESDDEAVEKAKGWGFEFEDKANPYKITKPYFAL